MSHLRGFSPVCIFICLVRHEDWVKVFPHVSHLKGFSPVWVFMCSIRREPSEGFLTFHDICIGLFQCEFDCEHEGVRMTQRLSHIPYIYTVALQCEFSYVQWGLRIDGSLTYLTLIGLVSSVSFHMSSEVWGLREVFPTFPCICRVLFQCEFDCELEGMREDTNAFHISYICRVFIPVWIRMWMRRYEDDPKAFPHVSHWKGFSPVCVFIWAVYGLGLHRRLFQNPHM